MADLDGADFWWCLFASLGIELLLAKPETLEIEAGETPKAGNALLFGFLVTFTNPKAIVLFARIFLQQL